MGCAIKIPESFEIIFSLLLGRKLEVWWSVTLRWPEFLHRWIRFLWWSSIQLLIFMWNIMRLFKDIKHCETVVFVQFVTSIWCRIILITYFICLGIWFWVKRILKERGWNGSVFQNSSEIAIGCIRLAVIFRWWLRPANNLKKFLSLWLVL